MANQLPGDPMTVGAHKNRKCFYDLIQDGCLSDASVHADVALPDGSARHFVVAHEEAFLVKLGLLHRVCGCCQAGSHTQCKALPALLRIESPEPTRLQLTFRTFRDPFAPAERWDLQFSGPEAVHATVEALVQRLDAFQGSLPPPLRTVVQPPLPQLAATPTAGL